MEERMGYEDGDLRNIGESFMEAIERYAKTQPGGKVFYNDDPVEVFDRALNDVATVERERDALWYAATAALTAKDRVNAEARAGKLDAALALIPALTSADERVRATLAAISPVGRTTS